MRKTRTIVINVRKLGKRKQIAVTSNTREFWREFIQY